MNSLKDYGDLFERLGLTELSVEEGDLKLTLRKERSAICNEKLPDITKDSENYIKSEEKANEKTEKEDFVEGTEVKAPLLGIFYEKLTDNATFKIGDSVKKGDVLCNIEAMKMLNEVLSPTDGVIKKIFAKDGDMVEYNQPLYIIS